MILERVMLETVLSVLLYLLLMEGHVKTGLNGGTLGTGMVPDIIWHIACVRGLSLAIGCEHANPRSRSFFASSNT